MERASNYMAIIIQQDATQYISFKCVNCSKCFGWYFTQHQELMNLCLHYVAFIRPLLWIQCYELLMKDEIPPEICCAVGRFE